LTPLQVGHEKMTIPEVIEHKNANTMVVMQIETQLAVDKREELLSVPGIDAVMVGPADLSVSLGVGGEFLHPTMVDAMEKNPRQLCGAQYCTGNANARHSPGEVLARARHDLSGLQQRDHDAVRSSNRNSAGIELS